MSLGNTGENTWLHRPHWHHPSSISKTSSRANNGSDYVMYKYLMPAHPAVFVWPSRAVIFTVIFLLTSSRSTASTTSFTPFATSSTYSSKTATTAAKAKTATTAAKAKTATTTSTATLLLVRFHAPFSIFLCAIITTSLALRAHSHTSTII